MSIINALNGGGVLCASGKITGTTGVGAVRGGIVTRTGLGAYTITGDIQNSFGNIDANNNPASAPIAQIIGGAAQLISIAGGGGGGFPNNFITVTTFTQAGAAVDADFNFVVLSVTP